MIGRYQVAFYTPQGRLVRLHDLTGTEQVAYSRRVADEGQFMMALPRDLADDVLLQRDALAQVYRLHPLTGQLQEDGTYFLRLPDHVPGDYEGLVISGVSPETLLRMRCYDPDDDPLAANGFSTKGGPATQLMREIVTEQLISPLNTARAFPGVHLAPYGLDGPPNYYFRSEIKAQYVFDILTDIYKATGVEFWLSYADRHPTGYPRFAFHAGRVGRNRSKAAHPDGPYVYMTQAAGNLAEAQLTIDALDERTVVVVLGKGANGNRLVYRQESDRMDDSPFAYREIVVEAGEADTLDELLSAADTGLAEHEAETTFTFRPALASGALYEQDWDLGDIVTVGHRGVEYTMQITGVSVTLSAGEELIEVEARQYPWA